MINKAHVSDEKKKVVKEIKDLAKKYPIIGVLDMENLPSPQLQKMRSTLKNTILIKMTKSRLIQVVLNDLEKDIPGILQLKEKMTGMPALIFTNESPFKLYKTLKASKSPAFAKPGQIAPRDIIVKEGKTPFAPGPVIGELGQLGIKAGIEDGKVVIKMEKLLVKEGEVINQKASDILTRLGIQPMEIGLNVTAILEKGVIFDKKVLDIDETQFINNLKSMHTEAFNLAVKIVYTSKDTIKHLLSKAHRDSISLADSKDIITDENIKKLVGKANAQAASLKNKVDI